jgi:hypothetical protein
VSINIATRGILNSGRRGGTRVLVERVVELTAVVEDIVSMVGCVYPLDSFVGVLGSPTGTDLVGVIDTVELTGTLDEIDSYKGTPQ